MLLLFKEAVQTDPQKFFSLIWRRRHMCMKSGLQAVKIIFAPCSWPCNLLQCPLYMAVYSQSFTSEYGDNNLGRLD